MAMSSGTPFTVSTTRTPFFECSIATVVVGRVIPPWMIVPCWTAAGSRSMMFVWTRISVWWCRMTRVAGIGTCWLMRRRIRHGCRWIWSSVSRVVIGWSSVGKNWCRCGPSDELVKEVVNACDIGHCGGIGVHSCCTVFAPRYAVEFAKPLDLVVSTCLIAWAFGWATNGQDARWCLTFPNFV